MADETTITRLPKQPIGTGARNTTTRPTQLRLVAAGFSTSRNAPDARVVKSLRVR